MTFYMKCNKCRKEFPESEMQESHDVPCYLFIGNRKARKNIADKFGRHWLCKNCHEIYEECMRNFLIKQAKELSLKYFEEKDG